MVFFLSTAPLLIATAFVLLDFDFVGRTVYLSNLESGRHPLPPGVSELSLLLKCSINEVTLILESKIATVFHDSTESSLEESCALFAGVEETLKKEDTLSRCTFSAYQYINRIIIFDERRDLIHLMSCSSSSEGDWVFGMSRDDGSMFLGSSFISDASDMVSLGTKYVQELVHIKPRVKIVGLDSRVFLNSYSEAMV